MSGVKFSFAVGDLNKDNKLDLVILKSTVSETTAVVRLGDGVGNFTIHSVIPLAVLPASD